jgi:hypothetical protein
MKSGTGKYQCDNSNNSHKNHIVFCSGKTIFGTFNFLAPNFDLPKLLQQLNPKQEE